MNRNSKIISLYEKINNEGLLQSLKSEEVYLCTKCQDFKKTDEFISELKSIARSFDIKKIYKLNKECLIKKIKKQQPYRKFHEDIFNEENYFNSSLKNTPEVYELIDVIQLNTRQNTKFKIYKCEYKINFKETLIKDLKPCKPKYKINYIDKALNEMVKLAKSNSTYEKGDRLSIALFNPNIKTPIYTGMRSDDIIVNLKSIINGLLTSNEEIDITETTFQVQVVSMPRGSKGDKIINLSKDINTKRSIIQIKNDDNLCCPRAIVVALSTQTNNILDHELDSNKIKQLKIGRKIQKDLTLELCNMLTEYNEKGFTFDDIKNVEHVLDIQVNVICAEHLNTLIYKGEDKKTKIYLYKNGYHFDVITSMAGFLGKSYYCKECDISYNNKDKHKCVKDKNVCGLCMKSIHLSSTKNKIYCQDCNRYCYNQECLDDHIFICMLSHKCIYCNKICQRYDDHKCGIEKCINCWKEVEIEKHNCYIQRIRQKGGKCKREICLCKGNYIKPIEDFTLNELRIKARENKIKRYSKLNKKELLDLLYPFISFSNEIFGESEEQKEELSKCTYTEKYMFFDYESQQETGIHIANKIIAHDFNGKKIMFDTNEEFCNHIISKEYKGYTFIAHYAKGYDSQFILKYLVDNTLDPFTIYNGTKLMLLEIKNLNIRIIDSSNFIQGPLSSFPKTFGLKELKKGYFPHLFNTVENQNYISILPDKKYYGYETMKTENKQEFEKWYDNKINENYIFNFKEELEAYCTLDVDIERRGCLELRKQFLEIANIDPFQYITIAGVCMAIYRSKYLLKDTIATLDKEKNENYSKQSITWLKHFNNINIYHALNGGEKIIAGSKVDGYDEKSKTVYQYHGCFWHGCTKCYKDGETINNINHETMDDLYQKTIERSTIIKNAGYNLIEQWDCDWINSNTYKKVEKADIVEPIKPRDAFFGGRTNATKLRVKNKKMRYIDVCSLYPTVMYYDYYPVGHPKKIFNPKVYDKNWFGLIKCKILPPRNLYHPVLPVKIRMKKSEKLLFPLCYKCAVDQNKICNHSQNERQFIGTWTTDEVNKALEKGYIITKMYEVWNFKEKTTDLFKEYIKNFMKIKLESSKHNYSSNEEYVKEVFDKMGILLDIKQISDNPGRRAVAKLCLVSLWGKFGQRQKMKKTEFVTDPQHFYKILLDDRLENINIKLLNDNMVQMCYNYKDYYIENCHNTNILIALFTTSSARLRLYKMLDKLGRAVVYFDTDSIFYIYNGVNKIKTGTMLGEWTDELGENVHITDWASTGPKSYYYKTNDDKFKTVIKGFTLNYQNLLKLNGEAMIKLIEENNNNNIELEYNQIKPDPLNKTLVNKTVTKKFSFEYDKRIILLDYDTIPYGYKL
ncbi:hypothetical protein AGLY_017373 [Aphis glycines]|uniref:DNA-directed DNA polymerase n=1 Tax=Aphis glycines TaxID=307491 RepID=A0A6G0SVP6_APHGL|nr:hypothetical protein AGLY_017373 [Aphis glycines]